MVKALIICAIYVLGGPLISPGSASEIQTVVADAVPVSNDYVLRSWDVYDGLPSNRVGGIAQTPDGYLWFATNHGIVRFDGQRFVTFLKKDTPGIEADDVRTVYVARDGVLWVGLERGGVARYTGDHFESIVPLVSSAEQTKWTNSFAEDSEGDIWFSYAPELKAFCWRRGKITSFSSKEGIGPGRETSLYADAKGAIWFATSEGLGVFDGHRFQPIKTNTPRPAWIGLAKSRDGGMWAKDGTKLLHFDANGQRRIIADLGGLNVDLLYEDRSGDLWIGTNNLGLVRFHEGSFVRVPTSHSNISALAEDRDGNLWAGTVGGGLDRLSPRSFSLHQQKDGLLREAIIALCKDSEERLWLAGIDGTPVRALDPTNRFFAVPPNWPGGNIMNLYADPAGAVWLGTLTGLMRWKNGTFTHENLSEGITALLQDRKGDLWVSTINNQLVCHKADSSNIYIPQDGGLVKPRALTEDSSGRIWVGTESGLVFQRQNDQFVPVPLSGAERGKQVRFIVPDINDTVWIGVYSEGLYRWHAGQVGHLPNEAGLPGEDLRTMTIEPDGHFWFGTDRGLFRVARNEINAVMDGTHSSLQATFFGRNDGLPSVEFSFGFRNTVTRTQDGHLWFATYSGALEFDPQKLQKESVPVSVLVEGIQLGGKALTAGNNGEVSLPPNPGPVQIHYTLPEMSSPEQIRFRYRLLGMGNEEWVEAGNQRVAVFSGLSPGRYRFEVAAAMAEGPWLPKTGTLAFGVKAAWWQTGFFRLGAAILAFLLVGWLARLIELRRVRARVRALEQEHALERERTRIARDIHDELGASLTHISIASELAELDPPEAVFVHIKDMAATARRAARLVREIVWAVNPRCDSLPSLIEYLSQYAIDFLTSVGIAYEMEVAENIPSYLLSAETRHNVLLVVKETLNNVAKHAGASKVNLKIDVKENQLRIVMTDNGRGFDLEHVRSGSNGLRNMRERMSEIGARYSVESSPGKGTCSTIELPLRLNERQPLKE